MDKEYLEYNNAKNLLEYNMSVSKSRKEDGTIDESKLDEILKRRYEYIRSQLLKRENIDQEVIKKDVRKLDYLYSLVKDEKTRKKFDELFKEERYLSTLPKICEDEVKGIIKEYNSKPSKGEVYQLEVFPDGENAKHIIAFKKRDYRYVTKLGVIAYLSEYAIVKNINGIDREFRVTTNTNFDKVNEILHSNRPLSENEKKYLKLFYNQMSDTHLKACQKVYNGYIGTVEEKSDSVKFDMDSEDYAATKEILSQEVKRNEEAQR